MDKRLKKMNNGVDHYENDDEVETDWVFPNLPTVKRLDNEIVVTLKHVQKGKCSSLEPDPIFLFNFTELQFYSK